MTGIYIGTNELKSAYVGTTPVKEIYVGTTKVRPSGWQPGADTVCYYPLTNDFVDASGNSSNITPVNNSSVIGEHHGVNCLNLNGYRATVSTIDALITASEYTFNFWLYRTGRFDIMYDDNGNRGAGGLTLNPSAEVRWGNTTNRSTLFSQPALNQWINVVLTVLNGEGSVYINNNKTVLKSSGVIAPDHNKTPLIIGGDYALNNQANGCISRLIIEKKGWTAQDVSDYYNLTKSNYGL